MALYVSSHYKVWDGNFNNEPIVFMSFIVILI